MSEQLFQLHFELTDDERRRAINRLRLLRLGDLGGIIGSSLVASYSLVVIGFGIARCFSTTEAASSSIGHFAIAIPLLAIIAITNFLALTRRSRPLVPLTEKIHITVFYQNLRIHTAALQLSVPWTSITGVIPAGPAILLITKTAFTVLPNRLLTPQHVACLRWLCYDSKHAPEKTFAFPIEPTSAVPENPPLT